MSDVVALKSPASLRKKRWDFHTLPAEAQRKLIAGLTEYRDKISLEKKSRHDPRTVIREAQCLVRMTGGDIKVKNNSTGRLPIIAVTGPAMTQSGIFVPDAVKLEIGLNRSLPYRRVEKVAPALWVGKRRAGKKNLEYLIPGRTKWTCLSPQEYCLVAPILFSRIQSITNLSVEKWKDGIEGAGYFFPLQTPFPLEVKHHQKRFGWVPKGVRFKASLQDKLFVSDIYWAELNLNRFLKEYLGWRVIKFARRLNQYRNGYKGPFLKLKKTMQVKYLIENLFISKDKYLLCEVAEQLHQKIGIARDELYDLVGWDREECWEHVAARHVLPNPQFRLGDMQIKVIRRTSEFLIFEVYPKPYL